jgi:hypothetical protein
MKQHLRMGWLIAAMAFRLALASKAGSPPPDAFLLDGVVAWVDGVPITLGEVYRDGEREFARLAMQRGMSREEKRLEQQRLVRAVLEERIAQELILAAFKRESAEKGLTFPKRAVDQRMEEVIRRRFGGDRRALAEALAKERLTLDEWRHLLCRQMIVEEMRAREISGKVRISPDAMRRYYEEHRAEFEHPGRLLLRRIVLVGPEAERRSEELRDRLYRNEADFAALAREYSAAPDAEEGGLWGWQDPADLAEPLACKLAQARVGGVVRVELGGEWHLVRLEARDRLEFESARPILEARLRREEMERLNRQWIERLKQQFHVQYVEGLPAAE